MEQIAEIAVEKLAAQVAHEKGLRWYVLGVVVGAAMVLAYFYFFKREKEIVMAPRQEIPKPIKTADVPICEPAP